MKSAFFQDATGKGSSSRVTAFIVVMCALLFSGTLLCVGLFDPTINKLLLSTSVGQLFIMIAAPAMVYMFNKKKQELNGTR